ncbi:MAG: hypothetical protein Kow0090_14920 [Myxococcota bacterium]
MTARIKKKFIYRPFRFHPANDTNLIINSLKAVTPKLFREIVIDLEYAGAPDKRFAEALWIIVNQEYSCPLTLVNIPEWLERFFDEQREKESPERKKEAVG